MPSGTARLADSRVRLVRIGGRATGAVLQSTGTGRHSRVWPQLEIPHGPLQTPAA